MRIGLIIPPSGFVLDDRVFPSLGILRVAAVLERAGHAVAVFDGAGVAGAPAAAAAWATASPADVYGLTATTPQMPAAAAIARAIRGAQPSARLVLGGPHVTLLNAAARREPGSGRATTALAALADHFDTVVAGDGEAAVFEALAPGAPRLIDADDPASARFLTPATLATLPWPARHLIDLDSYHFEIDGIRAVSLIGQLGCPFECGFCGGRLSPTFRRVRLRPSADVVAEMRSIHETYGVRGFMFLDDELNVNRALPDLCAGIAALQRDLGVTFHCRGLVKAELFTDAQAEALATAGFRQLLIGFESGAPRMLLNMNKKATRDENTRCLSIARRHGIAVKALMSLGHPGETADTIAETRDWLLAMNPAQFDATIITVYPGTPYYDHAQETAPGVWTYTAPKTGDRLHARTIDQFTDTPFYKGIPGSYHAYVWTDALSAEDLVALRDDLETTVRGQLGIPWPSGSAALQFEHSMGQR
jgi:radical SAM superfamily enzyme YgiQ (UPF0313 family)